MVEYVGVRGSVWSCGILDFPCYSICDDGTRHSSVNYKTFIAMLLEPGSYVTRNFLGTQIVTGHLYSWYLCYFTFIFQVPILLGIHIPGTFVTGHLCSRYLCYWTFIFEVSMLLDIYIPGTYVNGHLLIMINTPRRVQR